jgi:aspartate/methionine/tyrosine aminotransferase
MMAAAAHYLRAAVRSFPRRMEDGYRLDPDEVERRLSPRTRAIVVTDLHNPSSVRAEPAALRALATLAEETGAWLLVDEVYLEAVFEGDVRSAWHLGPRVLATSSLTKAYGLSGLRCGWILAPAETARALWRLNDVFAASAPHIPERLGVIAFQNLPALRERARVRLQAHRALLDAFLAGRTDLESVAVRGGTTSFPRLREGRVDALCARLKDVYETSVVPGRFFGADQHFRIGLGGETSDLQEGLARLGEALDDVRA